jgi:hypothetical protein
LWVDKRHTVWRGAHAGLLLDNRSQVVTDCDIFGGCIWLYK